MDSITRQIPQPPASTRDRLIGAVLVTVIVACVVVLLLAGMGVFSG